MFLVDIYIMKVWLKFLVLIELLVKKKYNFKNINGNWKIVWWKKYFICRGGLSKCIFLMIIKECIYRIYLVDIN